MAKIGKSTHSNSAGSHNQQNRNQSSNSKKKKRSAGKVSGSRNSQMEKRVHGAASGQHSSDRRLGSKKKISLVAETSSKAGQKRVVRKFKSPTDELDYIENDSRLQQLLDKIDRNSPVSIEEQEYVDALLSRHKLLCDLLGIDKSNDESEDDKDIDLLDKLEKDFKF